MKIIKINNGKTHGIIGGEYERRTLCGIYIIARRGGKTSGSIWNVTCHNCLNTVFGQSIKPEEK